MYANQATGSSLGSSLGSSGRIEAACQEAQGGAPREPEITDLLRQLNVCLDELRDVAGIVENRFELVLSAPSETGQNRAAAAPVRCFIGNELEGLRVGLRAVRDRLISAVNRAEI